jgi:DNA-binding NtrC family response regulator
MARAPIDQQALTEPLAVPSDVSERFALLLANTCGVRALPLPGQGSLTIGRGSDADLQIYDQAVSRVHLRIDVLLPRGPARVDTSELVQLVDLGSANGTYLRGERMRAGEPRALAPGDTIELGNTLLVLRRHIPARAPEPEPKPSQLERGTCEPELGEEMRAVLRRADRVAASDIPVLILGETGVGKDVIAERIHNASRRGNARFLRLNCASFSASLLESELFGHVKGAFTGATGAKQGLLQAAAGGTVLLDELGELPLELQAKLLLVVERREVLSVGAEQARPIDVRFIAATHRDLHARVRQGLFREDLYHRLNGVPIAIPPLRERRSEIAGLARLFATNAARSLGRLPPALAQDALQILLRYPWPGNIRELRSTMERAVVLGDQEVVHAHDLLACLERDLERADSDLQHVPERGSERERILAALGACAGNQSRASRLLGMSRNTFIARLKKYGVARPLAQRECE